MLGCSPVRRFTSLDEQVDFWFTDLRWLLIQCKPHLLIVPKIAPRALFETSGAIRGPQVEAAKRNSNGSFTKTNQLWRRAQPEPVGLHKPDARKEVHDYDHHHHHQATRTCTQHERSRSGSPANKKTARASNRR